MGYMIVLLLPKFIFMALNSILKFFLPKDIGNYSVLNIAINDKAFKTF